MAGISFDRLRELAAFRAEQGYAVSLYVGLDPSAAPTPADVETRVNAQLSEAHRLYEERRSTLTHDQQQGLKADLERIRTWFDTDFDRQGARGVAVFAAGLDNFWSTLALPAAVGDAARVGRELFLAPLATQVGREGALVAYVGRERGQVYRLRDGALVEIADQTDEVPGRHDQGGWSQGRYERHIEELVNQHLREVAETIERCVRRLRGLPIVLVGPEEVRPEFAGLLSKEATDCLAGWTSAEAHADGRELLEAARPLLEEWWAGREEQVLERWRQEAGRNGRAAAGWEQTLEAASDGRVELLLVQDGVSREAYECPQCGRVQMSNGRCPLDGTTLESRDDGVDVAVHKTLAHGGSVHVVRDREDLGPVGGLAALLRF
ncbi:MAG TPA: Vms1/Ankzf1 family peptidyl-tRNA hydrolase [Gaiellaceae bacterium]|nr:Vms1/Ankzf1 family peptidyl-tRNA hydrolase [Gaiellaceae bacterium]